MKLKIDGRDKTHAIHLNLKVHNQFDTAGIWVRGSLHSHITPDNHEAFIQKYIDYDFDFVAVTNYLTITPVTSPAKEKILCIPGAELFWPAKKDLIHIICIGLKHDLQPLNGTMKDIARVISETAEQGGLSILAHPAWSGYNWEQLNRIASMGIDAFELTNRNCWAINGKGRSEELWQLLLDAKHTIPVTGCDDISTIYQDHVLGKCWTGVLVEKKTEHHILESIRQGRVYASEGPHIYSIRFTPEGTITVETSPCIACHIRSQGFGLRSILLSEPKQYFTIDLRIEGYRIKNWISVCIEDAAGKRAWSSAIPVEVIIRKKDSPETNRMKVCNK